MSEDVSWEAMATSQLLYELQYTAGQVHRLLSDRRPSTRSWREDVLRQFRKLQAIVDVLADSRQVSEFNEALRE